MKIKVTDIKFGEKSDRINGIYFIKKKDNHLKLDTEYEIQTSIQSWNGKQYTWINKATEVVHEILEPEIDKPEINKGVDWDAKERRSTRSMCVSYAKDMVVSGSISVGEIATYAESMVAFIYKAEEKEEPDNGNLEQPI